MRSRTDRLTLLLALGLSTLGAWGLLTLPLDVRNESMKSAGDPASAAQERRDREFGPEDAVVAMLEPRGSAVSGSTDDPEVARWLAALRASPDHARVQVLPQSGAEATLVSLRVARGGDELEHVLARLHASAPATHRLAVTGQPVGELAIARALAEEQSRVVPAILATLTLLLLLVYRSSTLASAALMPGLGAILGLGGIQRLLGTRIDPVSSLLAPVVLTVGVAGAVHVVESYLARLARGAAPRDAASGAVRALAGPLVLTSATTVAGFLTLTAGSIPAVRRFGGLAALGVLLALAWVVAVVPAWLRATGERAGHATSYAARRTRIAGEGRSAGYVTRIARAAPLLVAATLAASLFLAWHGARAATDTEPLRVLPPGHPFRLATARVEARLGGNELLELYLPPPHPPLAPLAAAQLVARLAADPLVATPAGPPRRSEAGSLLAGALLRPGGTAEREALFLRAERAARELGFAGARAIGPAVRVARDSEALVRDQRRGLAAMMALLWALMAVGLRSGRLALLGLVPNAVPCIALYGGLELAGRPLSVATAMIATVLLGLVVDNTIHLLHGYAGARERGSEPRAALTATIARNARAVVTTSAVLALGFGAGLAGRLATTAEFAGLAAATIVLALGCDLVLLPAILLLPARRRASGPASAPAELSRCIELEITT